MSSDSPERFLPRHLADARESYVVADAPSRRGEIRPAERLDRNAETFGRIAARYVKIVWLSDFHKLDVLCNSSV